MKKVLSEEKKVENYCPALILTTMFLVAVVQAVIVTVAEEGLTDADSIIARPVAFSTSCN